MRILLMMDAAIPVPPPLYGGHERLVAMFAKEYERLGHEVHLLAGPGSQWSNLHTFGKNGYYKNHLEQFGELWEVWLYLKKHHQEFDLIHNFGRLLFLLPILNKNVFKIMTYGRDVTGSAIKNINRLPNKNLIFTACSNNCANTGNTAGVWKTVYNAIEFDQYDLNTKVSLDAPLMFLGRIEALKGTHTAVQVALKTKHSLWIAGNIEEEHQTFYEQEILPYVDGQQIVYLGPLNDEQKNYYLGKSKALLFPIEWEEPFGMVMVEAMACGTPVIAYPRGAVPEVVEEGVTGFIVNNLKDMIDAVSKIGNVERMQCRTNAMKKFDVKVVAQNYLDLVHHDESIS
ncbi:MAG: glycosyltransferase family 4 protein [Pelobium sp.]